MLDLGGLFLFYKLAHLYKLAHPQWKQLTRDLQNHLRLSRHASLLAAECCAAWHRFRSALQQREAIACRLHIVGRARAGADRLCGSSLEIFASQKQARRGYWFDGRGGYHSVY